MHKSLLLRKAIVITVVCSTHIPPGRRVIKDPNLRDQQKNLPSNSPSSKVKPGLEPGLRENVTEYSESRVITSTLLDHKSQLLVYI